MPNPHFPDKTTTSLLQRFEPTTSQPEEVAPVLVPEVVPVTPEPCLDQDVRFTTHSGRLYLKYQVCPSIDTLFGVALKFGIEPGSLKKINKLTSDLDFCGCDIILIPWDASKVCLNF